MQFWISYEEFRIVLNIAHKKCRQFQHLKNWNPQILRQFRKKKNIIEWLTTLLWRQIIVGGGSGTFFTRQVRLMVLPLFTNRSGAPTIMVTGSENKTTKSRFLYRNNEFQRFTLNVYWIWNHVKGRQRDIVNNRMYEHSWMNKRYVEAFSFKSLFLLPIHFRTELYTGSVQRKEVDVLRFHD